MLQHTELTTITNAQCERYFKNYTVIESEMCAISRTSAAATGDSGGPLWEGTGENAKVVGIVKATGNASRYPAIFERASFFQNWFNESIKKLEVELP